MTKIIGTFMVDSATIYSDKINPGDKLVMFPDGEELIIQNVYSSTSLTILPNTLFNRFLVRFYRFIGYHSFK